MNKNFLNIYNNLIQLTRNKLLYKNKLTNETFSDRLIIFLFHFAFFLKIYKNKSNKAEFQNLYDFIFYQIELSIREIGYGDQSINKKMKDYINLFHSILSEIHFWGSSDYSKKQKILSNFLKNFDEIENLTIYFDEFRQNLLKKTLNSYLKSVSNQ